MSMRWYIVHAYSNFEKKVSESIREQAKQRGLEDLFEQVLVPTEKVTEVRRGRKIDAERKFFPGYVLVKMNLTDEAFHLIRTRPGDGLPRRGKQSRCRFRKPKPCASCIRCRKAWSGRRRRCRSRSARTCAVTDGPFASFSGVVEEIDEARSRVKVAVSIFGRATPVELEFDQVEKV